MPTLTWTGKEDAIRTASLVPFRLLEPHTAIPGGIVGDPKAAQDNLLIQGDDLGRAHKKWKADGRQTKANASIYGQDSNCKKKSCSERDQS